MDQTDRSQLNDSTGGVVVQQDDVFVATVQPVSIRNATAEDLEIMRKQMTRDIEYMYGQKIPQFLTIRHTTSMILLVQLVCFIIYYLVAMFVIGHEHTNVGFAFGISVFPFVISLVVAGLLHYRFNLTPNQTVFHCFTGFITTILIMILVIYFGNLEYESYHLNDILNPKCTQVITGCNTTIKKESHFLLLPQSNEWSIPGLLNPKLGDNIFNGNINGNHFCVAHVAYNNDVCRDLVAVCTSACTKDILIDKCSWDQPASELFLNENNAFGENEDKFDQVMGVENDAFVSQLIWRGREETYFRKLLLQMRREFLTGSALMAIFYGVVSLTMSVYSKWLWPLEKLHTIRRWQEMVTDGNPEE